MKKICMLVLFSFLFADSPFDSPKEKAFDVSVFETKANSLNKQAQQNNKVKCRWVCDKQIYKQQKIADAILFYRHTREY